MQSSSHTPPILPYVLKYESLSPSFDRWAIVAAALSLLIAVLVLTSSKPKIHSVGYSYWLGSYFGAFRFLLASHNLVREGYHKYKSHVFRVPQFNHWTYIVTGDQLIDELHKTPDHVMSLLDSAREELQIPYTMGNPIHDNPYHLHILRHNLTRRLDMLIETTMDEIAPAFESGLPMREGSDWTEVRAQANFEQLVARVFNRALVGAPTCRDRRYLDLSLQFTVDTVLTSFTLNLFPKFMRSILGPIVSRLRLPRTQRLALEYLGPLIEERKRLQAEYDQDNWADKPDDVLSWLMDEAEGPERENEALATRILIVNSATIHTSSMTFTQAIFNLAFRPEYIEPLRQEAEETLRLYGWNKLGMNELPKMDSFFKESMRLNGLGSIGFPRITLQDYTFSDGTSIPRGTYVSAALTATHLDEANYENAATFDGYRFLGKSSGKHAMAVTSSRYLPFGHGKHACPGRFIVAYVLKAMMCHLLIHYDLKIDSFETRPSDTWFSYACIPNRGASVMLRRRTSN